jgi:structure-specific endonuclease subunit SLX1
VQFEREGRCTLCKGDLEHDAGIYAVCPNTECDSVTHLTCLGNYLLEDADSVVPINGNCPSCKTELRWVDVVKEVTLRLRGQKEVEKLLKVKRARKGITASQAAVETFDDDDELSEEEVLRDIEEDLEMLSKFDPRGTRADIDETWQDIDDSDDSDTRSFTSTATSRAAKAKGTVTGSSKAGTLRTVIEDSDWEDAILVD